MQLRLSATLVATFRLPLWLLRRLQSATPPPPHHCSHREIAVLPSLILPLVLVVVLVLVLVVVMLGEGEGLL